MDTVLERPASILGHGTDAAGGKLTPYSLPLSGGPGGGMNVAGILPDDAAPHRGEIPTAAGGS